MKKTINKMINKVLRWLRFHKPENLCRSSYITNQDKYYFEIKDRIGLGNDDAKRSWAIHRRV